MTGKGPSYREEDLALLREKQLELDSTVTGNADLARKIGSGARPRQRLSGGQPPDREGVIVLTAEGRRALWPPEEE